MLAELDHGLANARDLGGLLVAGGRHTKAGVLFRSDAPMAGELDPPLQPWPPTTVIDLRSAEEFASDHPLNRPGVTVYVMPLISAANPIRMAAAGQAFTLHDLYLSMVNHSGEMIAKVVDGIASAPGACLVHCAVGKDRTGVVVAIVLSALGASRETILDDYELTAPNMAAVIDRIVSTRPADEREKTRVALDNVPNNVFGTDRVAIESVLDVVEGHDGGAAGWLISQGLSPAKLTLLADRLVDAA